jgi:hypothetical protein
LLSTSIFSYLALSEARQARVEQRAHFLAERTPEFDLIDLVMLHDQVLAIVKNTGDSVATSVKLNIFVLKDGAFSPVALAPQYAGNPLGEHRGARVHKGAKALLPACSTTALVADLGFKPVRFEVPQDFGLTSSCKGLAGFFVRMKFLDVSGNWQHREFAVHACRE